jgi:hypothetical protein
MTARFDQDPDPDLHWFGSLDLDPHSYKSWNPNADRQHRLKEIEYSVPRDKSSSSCKKPGTIS